MSSRSWDEIATLKKRLTLATNIACFDAFYFQEYQKSIQRAIYKMGFWDERKRTMIQKFMRFPTPVTHYHAMFGVLYYYPDICIYVLLPSTCFLKYDRILKRFLIMLKVVKVY